MLHFSDSKAMAKALRKALAERQIDITHADALELVARQFGFANWNMLSARIDSADQPLSLPDGWIVGGQSRPGAYRLGIDPGLPGAIKIEAMDRDGVPDGFSTLMQSIAADDYRGKTIRIRADLRSRGADQGALWMRIDPEGGGRHLRIDNMLDRQVDGPLHGDMEWTGRSVVLDVPEEAGTIHYGVLLKGSGELWARDVRLDAVDPAMVAVTQKPLPKRPTNLEFRPGDGKAA